MITRVRIAPVEHWCEVMQKAASFHERTKLGVGMEIGIEASSMREGQPSPHCGGREWLVPQLSETFTPYNPKTGELHGNRSGWICEHMLEMD